MEQNVKDRALMQALTPKEPKHLPSNFPYLTLQRIKEQQRAAEHRQRVTVIATVVSVSLAGIIMLIVLYGKSLWQSFAGIWGQADDCSLVVPTLICLLFFALLNHWLARQYHQKGHA